MSDLHNYRRDLAVLDPAGGRNSPQNNHNQNNNNNNTGPTFHISPWMAPNGASSQHQQASNPSMATSFYNDDSDLSAASPLSPAFRIGAGASSRNAAQSPPTAGGLDVSDIAPFADERRPSLASIATASSQGSRSSVRRGGMQKLQGFFGEEFPGRDSSETSLQSSQAGKDRSHSYSHSARPTRERNFSNATDHTREASPSSSRPRTPVPAPEVVPFLYQNSDVRRCLLFSFPCHPSMPVPLPPPPAKGQSRRPWRCPPSPNPASAKSLPLSVAASHHPEDTRLHSVRGIRQLTPSRTSPGTARLPSASP